MVNPIQTKGFAQSVLKRNKTDQLDAKLIAQFCQAIKPNLWKPLSSSVTTLQALVRRLDDLQHLYLQEQNRLESADKTIIASIKAILDVLQAQIKHIQQQIEAHIKTANY